MPTTSLKLDAEIKARVQRLAESRQRSATWMMREAVREFVEREEKREQLRRDALAAWAEYQETGRHMSAKGVDRWLARLEAGEVAPPPECHG